MITYFHVLPNTKRMRYSIIEPKNPRGETIIVVPGRREFIEKKYFETADPLLQRGYRLVFFEWLGQGGSDRYLTGEYYQRDHITNFDTYLADFRSFYHTVIKPQSHDRITLLSHSMGGHLMLRWLAEDRPAEIQNHIMTAPMFAIGSPTFEWEARLAAGAALLLQKGDHYAWSHHDYDDADRKFAGNPLSNDPERFAIIEQYFTMHPEMKVGGITWQWLTSALHSMQRVRQPRYLASITQPSLIIYGDHDHVTPYKYNHLYAERLPFAKLLTLDHALHDILNEKEDIRYLAWKWIDEFLGLT